MKLSIWLFVYVLIQNFKELSLYIIYIEIFSKNFIYIIIKFFIKYILCYNILSNILAKQDAKLIANIWDRTGNIILNGTELCNIIAALCNIDVNAVSIVYGDEEPGCLTKIKPLKPILNIKIDNKDFKLFYNEPYNILQDEFRISLSTVLIA